MRIPCPHCGERDAREFLYLGDATVRRPDANSETAMPDFVEYVFMRSNPAGPHREFWFHNAGCQRWLVVTRDTTTHAVIKAEFAAKPVCG